MDKSPLSSEGRHGEQFDGPKSTMPMAPADPVPIMRDMEPDYQDEIKRMHWASKDAESQYELNVQGRFSQEQVCFLLYKFVLLLALTLVFPLLAIWQNPIKVVLFMLLAAIIFTMSRGVPLLGLAIDLLKRQPTSVTGPLDHRVPNTRYQLFYRVIIAQVSIRVPKREWELLKEGRAYEMFFAAHSKWLLSYKDLATGYYYRTTSSEAHVLGVVSRIWKRFDSHFH